MKMRNPRLRPGKQRLTQIYEFFYNICIVWWCGFFSLYSDTINAILQLKFCIEEEYRSRIASAFSNKTNRFKIKEMH